MAQVHGTSAWHKCMAQVHGTSAWHTYSHFLLTEIVSCDLSPTTHPPPTPPPKNSLVVKRNVRLILLSKISLFLNLDKHS
jgi:hypothetical protein